MALLLFDRASFEIERTRRKAAYFRENHINVDITQAHEIDTFATGTAKYLIRTYPEEKILEDLSKEFIDKIGIEDIELLVRDFQKTGGLIWERFLKRIYDSIVEPREKFDKLLLKSELARQIKDRK